MTRCRSVAGLAGVVAVLLGCWGEGRAPREPVTAVWVGAESAPASQEHAAALRAAGVGELFVEVAELEVVDGGRPATRQLRPARPTGDWPVSLVVTGIWDGLGEPEDLAAAVAAGVPAAVAWLERSGLVPISLHLDLAVPPEEEAWEAYAEALEELRDELDPALGITAAVEPAALGLPDELLRDAAGSTDAFVTFVHGQREGVAEEPARWDLRTAAAPVARLEAIGEPYLLGLSTLGTATALDRQGRELATTRGTSWAAVARARGLVPSRGFALEGIDRHVLSFDAESAWRQEGLAVPAGGRVRLSGTSGRHLVEALAALRALPSEHRLGEVIYRLPGTTDGLTLGAATLAAALAGEAVGPRPEVELRPTGPATFHVVLRNRSDAPSDLAVLDANTVQVTVEGGTIVRAEPGDFAGYDLLAGAGDDLARVLRGANVLRLHLPLLDGGERLESGPVTVRRTGRGDLRFLLQASFLAPYGEMAEYGPFDWPPATAAAADQDR